MKKQLLQMKSIITLIMVSSASLLNAQQWDINGNTGTNIGNYVGTADNNSLYFRVNGSTTNPGQALLNEAGSFIVESTNNSNTVKTKGSIVAGGGNILGSKADASIVGGWGNDLSNSGGMNLIAGQSNVVLNDAVKSVALGWKNIIRDSNQFAIGVGVDLATQYSGGFGVDLIATGTRSFVFGSGGGGTGGKLTNNIPYSIMFGVTSTPTMIIRDQMVGLRTTSPTANFHSVGTVRLQGLPNGTGKALVIDNNGNLMVSTSILSKTANDENAVDLQAQIDDLKKEITELKELLKQNKTIINVGSESNVPKLYQNAPNPAKGQTSIKYYLPNDSKDATINIYNISGQLIKTIALKEKGNGSIDITGLQGGTYLYQMTVDNKNINSKKMLIQD